MCPVCQSQAQTCLGKTELQTHQREALHTKRKTSIRLNSRDQENRTLCFSGTHCKTFPCDHYA